MPSMFRRMIQKRISKQKKRSRTKRTDERGRFSVLTEDCLAEILSRTSPRDACRAAVVCKDFKSAADSDAVWEKFLPPDYKQLIERAVSPVIYDSKKQIYRCLSKSHIFLDHGYLSFKLDKKNGKKSYMLGIMELYIEGQDDPKCWTWSPISRFPKVGILEAVDQIKIRASIPAVLLSRKSRYVAYLVFRIVGVSLDLQKPTKRMGSYAGREIDQSIIYLQRPSVHCIQRYWQKNGALPRKRGDGWKEIKLGEFYSDEGEDGEFVMAFEEIRDEYDTSALIVEGIDLRQIGRAHV